MVTDSLVENRKSLIHFLNTEMESLTGILRVYLLRAGLVGDENTTAELVNSVVVEALAHAERYNPARPARAWLLGIGANLVRRRQAESARLNQRETQASDLAGRGPAGLGVDELFELLAVQANAPINERLQAEVEARDGLAAALSQLSVEERRVVRLFIRCSLNGDALATALHVSPGAARVRLHRALAHLRQVWHLTEEKHP